MVNCLLVGLGQMGWRYDVKNNGVLTHAKAISEHETLHLLAAVDPLVSACCEFKALYPDVLTFSTIEEAGAQLAFDWIILALPTALHFDAFNRALLLRPKVIVCEKPLAPSLTQAREMVAQAQGQGCRLYVNYIRPHEPYCKEMCEFIRAGSWGGVQKVVVRYGKGIANSASHFIQLLVQEFGYPQQVRIISENDTHLADPEPDFILNFGVFSAVFLRFDYQCYALSEMDFYLERGAIFYRALGQHIEYQEALPDAIFSNVKRLSSVKTETTELMNYQRHAVAAYYSDWSGDHNPTNIKGSMCLAQSALDALAVVETLNTQLIQLLAGPIKRMPTDQFDVK